MAVYSKASHETATLTINPTIVATDVNDTGAYTTLDTLVTAIKNRLDVLLAANALLPPVNPNTVIAFTIFDKNIDTEKYHVNIAAQIKDYYLAGSWDKVNVHAEPYFSKTIVEKGPDTTAEYYSIYVELGLN